jgi:endonuclease YncB( thermonuclease family)
VGLSAGGLWDWALVFCVAVCVRVLFPSRTLRVKPKAGIELTRKVIRWVFPLLLLAFQSPAADLLSGRVVGVADGDTVTVLDRKHEQHKIRLSGIDAPEKAQPFGSRSKQSLADLAYGRAVSVEWRKRDRYRRIVGKMIEGGRDVNLEQSRRGMAWHYKRYQKEQDAPDRMRYRDAEIEAREARLGLWVDPKPILPWSWRRALRKPLGAKLKAE